MELERKMKYCSHCGAQLLDEAVFCPKCGCGASPKYTEPDIPSTGLNILACCFPIIGLILYLVNNNKAPKKANAIGKWAIIGFVIGLVLNMLLFASI